MNGRIENLILSIICFLVILPFVLMLNGCNQPTWDEVEPAVGRYKLYATITVQEDWCLLDGEQFNGVIRYNTKVRSIADICVSLKSDDPQRTMNHELDHAWRNAVGLDAQAMNQ